jgi:aminotransferase
MKDRTSSRSAWANRRHARHVREAAIHALEKGKTYYTNLGLIEWWREISKYVEEHFGIATARTTRSSSPWASAALDLWLPGLCNPAIR